MRKLFRILAVMASVSLPSLTLGFVPAHAADATKPDEAKQAESKPDEAKKTDTTSEETKAEEATKPDTKPEEGKAEETKKPDTKPEEGNPETVKKAEEPKKEEAKLSPADEGKKLAFDRAKGNCLACHVIAGGELPGNIGPPLAGVSARYPDKAKLRAQVYDARVANPHTIMIPFGPMGILNDEELDKVVAFISTL